MGAVDKYDHCREIYTTDQRSTRKWTTKIFFFVLDTATVNSYVLCKLYQSGNLSSRRQSVGKTVIDRQLFQRALGIGLVCRGKGWDVDDFESKWRAGSVPDAGTGPSCFPELIPDDGRLRCHEHRNLNTRYRCGVCLTPLCLNKDRNCFRDHVQ